MLATTSDVRFHCPSCGAALRTRARDGGTVLTCHLCGEAVRVPRSIPLAESTPFISAVPPAEARGAVMACGLLQWALAAVVMQVAVGAAGYAVWAAWLGPAKLLERDPGVAFNLLLPFWLLDLALLLSQTGLKLWGYRKLAPAAHALGCGPWVSAASVAVMLRVVGYSLACVPWLTGRPLEMVPMVWKAVAQVGHLAWMLGLVTEFAILALWYRVFAEVGGAPLTRIVFRYAAVCLGAFLTLSAGMSLTLITLVAAIRKTAPVPEVPVVNGARLDFAALPSGEYWPVLVLGLVALLIGSGLAGLYAGLLRSARRGLAALAE